MASFKHNKVDIYIKERNGTGKVRVPWLPATIEYKNGEQIVARYDILNRGEVEIPSAVGLSTISWSSQLPGKNRRTDTSMLRGTWASPASYDKTLKRWLNNKTELTVTVTGYPINMDVHLSKYESTAAGGFGDMEYTVEFREDKDLTISTTSKKKLDQNSTKKRQSKNYTTYIVRKGDKLWSIAQRTLGSGAKANTIYLANRDIIELTARQHKKRSSDNGWWIYPGTKLRIPPR